MQLVRLEMYGFKSFANKTEFNFSPGITAFVGPNGCGKSNVVDAIRWVLGEQNPRAMRANKMEDLVFAGSENSQHKNYAEVSIVLDNSDNEIPLDYREVTVTRRYYRSGDSEYFLNKVPCRLKDIGEVLAATSLGRGTYSIIGQGQVEEVINSRPEDRRLMFEEAAGIALYKLRKREAMKKLSDTRVNLTRIEDIIHELQNQEEDVRDSAGRAEEYLDYKGQADRLELALWAGKYQELQKRLEKQNQRRRGLEESREQYREQLRTAEGKLAEATGRMQECSEVIGVLEENKSQLAGNKTELEYKLQLSEQRQLDFQNMVAAARQQVTRLKAQLEESGGGLDRVRAEITELTEQAAKYSDALKARNNVAGLVRRLLAAVESCRSRADDLIMKAAMQSTEAAAHRDEVRQTEAELAGQMESLRQELAGWKRDAAAAREEINTLQITHAEIDQKSGTLSDEDAQLAERERELAQIRDTQALKVSQLVSSQTVLDQKLEMLKNMELEFQGFPPGTRAVLTASRDGKLSGVLGAVPELIQVRDPGHSLAVETALGGALNYVVCVDEDTCRRAIEMLKRTGSGRATLVPVTAAASRKYGPRPDKFRQPVLGWADELVSCSGEAAPVAAMLLGNILVTENLATATKLAMEINYRYKIVTLDGEVISRGLFTGGASGKHGQGLLQRKAAVAELNNKLQEQECALQQLRAQQAASTKEYNDLLQVQKRVSSRKEEAERELFRIQTQLEQAGTRLKQTEERAAGCSQRMVELETKIQQTRQVMDGIAARLNDDQAGLGKLQENKKGLQNSENVLKDMVSLWASRQNSLQLAIYSLQNLLEDRQRQYRHLESQESDLQKRLLALEEEARSKHEQYKLLSTKMDQTKLALSELMQGLESVAASLDGQLAAQGEMKTEIEATNKEIAGLRDELESINSALHEAELREARWQTEAEAMVRELGSQFGKEPDEGLSCLDNRYTINEMSAKLKKLQGRMDELGEINLAAISQHKKLVQRLEFLTEQRRDLLKAEEDIMNLVAELDDTIRSLFMETFESVQQQFTDIFKVLFDGGSAYLSLSDEGDLLETGIEIFARPPGKKTQSLSLLSGGEKSMTAIALLFALQSVRPSPFCILDEIEAALDDVNIVRFADYLRQLAETMQFILITHRRETMEHSDSLYGVTLSKEGASQPISVVLNKESQRVEAI